MAEAKKDAKKKNPWWQTAILYIIGAPLVILICLALIKYIWAEIFSIPPSCGDSVAVHCPKPATAVSAQSVPPVSIEDVPSAAHEIVARAYSAPVVRVWNSVTGQVDTRSTLDPYDDASTPRVEDVDEKTTRLEVSAETRFFLSKPLRYNDQLCWKWEPKDAGSRVYLYGRKPYTEREYLGQTSFGNFDHYILVPVNGTVIVTMWIARDAICTTPP